MPVIRSISITRSAGTSVHFTTAARVRPSARATSASKPFWARISAIPPDMPTGYAKMALASNHQQANQEAMLDPLTVKVLTISKQPLWI